MRRLVDTLIFVLIAYSLGWPLVRGVVDHGSPPATVPTIVAVHLPGLDAIPAATVRLAPTADDAARGLWIAEGVQHAGVPGASVMLAADLTVAWASVELPGLTTAPIEIRLDDRSAPIDLTLSEDLCLVTGRVPPTNRHVRISVQTCDGEHLVDVPCDARGGFVFALPLDDDYPRRVAIASERRRMLAERTVPAAVTRFDLGDLRP